MSKSTQPIVARLLSLQTAAKLVPGGARVIAEPTDRNPVAQILRTANETLLGRALHFASSSGPSLTLDVAGRRVLRLSSASGLAGAETCLGAEVLEDEHKDALIKLLQGVAAPRHELRVTSGPIGRGGEGVSVGLPVALLADLLLIELNEITPDEPDPISEVAVVDEPWTEPDAGPGEALAGDGLPGFAERLGPGLIAWLILGGDEDGRAEGPEEMVSHLQGFLGDETDALNRQLDMISTEPGGPICIVLGATLVEGHSIVCVRADTAMLLGVIEGDGTKTMLSAWKAAAG